MWCGKMFVKSRSSLMTLDRFSSIIAIQSQTNLILIEEKVYYFPKTNSSQQIPSWVIYDQLLQSYISMKLKSMSFF